MPPCYAFSMEPYELIRSRRKTLALEITKDCRVVVRAPLRMSEKRIQAFVESHGDWITRHLERRRERAASLPPPPTEEEIEALKARARALRASISSSVGGGGREAARSRRRSRWRVIQSPWLSTKA